VRMKPVVEPIDVTRETLDALLAQVRPKLTEDEYRQLNAVVDTVVYLAHVLEHEKTTVARLRALLCGSHTEQTRQVLARAGLDAGPSGPPPTSDTTPTPDTDTRPPTGRKRPARPGHGRHGADAYPGAHRVTVPHQQLTSGDPCPACAEGRVYTQRDPGVRVRFVGQAPIAATVYALEKLRCHLCGEVFTALPPAGVGDEKYDATTGAMVALLKYGSGVPFYRIARLQANVHLPLPASTQWDIVAEMANRIRPVMDELIRHAADGEVLHNDDTSMTVLSLRAPRSPDRDLVANDDVPPERTGVFTSGIVATREDRRLALFFTGRRHAGENLAAVLAHRARELGPPIQMCDALSRNPPKAFAVIVAHCLTHARRHIVDVTSSFPTECRYVLEMLRDVYAYDAQARAQDLSPEARLAFHQRQSGPLMDDLQTWLTAQFDEHHVEPNSGLGEAIRYFLKHWTELTRFLQVAGAPLDNNICERALKKAILHRKNALFYKTSNGAHVGDLFMSLIHTCELCRTNPFEYLTALQRHAPALPEAPAAWMPWNYRQTLQSLDASTEPAPIAAGTRVAHGASRSPVH
jgi:transposase